MSVVREILGVRQKSDAAPIASVLSSISTAAPTKKRKSFKAESREVASLRDTMNVIPLSPGMIDTTRTKRHWRWVPYRNTARGGDETNMATLAHWDHRGGDESPVREDYTAVKFNIPAEIPSLESVQDSQLLDHLAQRYSINKDVDIKLLFDLLSKFELRFPIAVDRFNSITGHDISITAVKDIFYTVYAAVWPGRKCKYSVDQDEERREILQENQESVAMEGLETVTQKKKEEKRIISEIKEIEEQLKEIDDPFFNDMVSRSALWPRAPPVTAASLQKKPTGYEHVAKNLVGFVGVTGDSTKSTGSSSSLAPLMNSFVKQNSVDFTAIKQIPNFCSSVSSYRIADFFHQLAQLIEKEKALNGFVRKRENDIKTLVKNS